MNWSEYIEIDINSRKLLTASPVDTTVDWETVTPYPTTKC